jgi:hypothetical protein
MTEEKHDFDPNVNIAYSSHDQRLLYSLQDTIINQGLRLQNINTRLLEVENLLADLIDKFERVME